MFFAATSVQANFTSQDSAWFLEADRVVRYCVVRDSSFSVSDREVQSALDWAIAKWATYIEESQIQSRPAALRLATRFQSISHCADADLQILLGVHSAEIDAYKKRDFYHPVAFTKRLKYDAKAGWSQGLLWISNDVEYGTALSWQSTLKFKAIVLHELGHLFGVGHMSGTIMQENILSSLMNSTTSEYFMTQIPNAWELVSPVKNEWSTGTSYSELGELAPEAFSKLIGRAPQGGVRGRWLSNQRQILIEDELSQYVLNVTFSFERVEKTSREPLFYAYRLDNQNRVVTANASRESFVKIGTLTTLSGESLTIIVEKNLTERQMRISFQRLVNGSYEALFVQPCATQAIPLHGTACFPIYPEPEGQK